MSKGEDEDQSICGERAVRWGGAAAGLTSRPREFSHSNRYTPYGETGISGILVILLEIYYLRFRKLWTSGAIYSLKKQKPKKPHAAL